MKTFVILGIFVVALCLSGCAFIKKETPAPAVVPPEPKTDNAYRTKLKIIGAVEPIYILPMKSAFEARIDTGASISSLDATAIREFERDGEKWVSFEVKNRRSGEVQTFEKPIVRNAKIRRIHQKEHRIIVKLDVSFGGKKFSADFTLANREKFDYQVLIGRNILSGRAIVDTSRSLTLK